MKAGLFASLIRGDAAHLCLLATTDLHMNILPYDYDADRPADRPGLALVARAVAQMRAALPNVLLFDNGDFLQGSPMGDFFALDRGLGPNDVHPMIAAMNTLGFDAGTLGNHEFNYGLDFLLRALRDARFPIVCANLLAQAGPTPGDDVPLVAPYALVRRDLRTGDGGHRPITIGILGLAPPQTVQWEGAALAGRAVAREMVEAARHHVPQMRAEGADLVIALAHTGIGPACPALPGQENAARALAAVPGIDALVLGHQHLLFPSQAFEGIDAVDSRAGTIGGKPAVMSGHSGRHLGVIDLHLAPQQGKGWAVSSAQSRVLDLGEGATATPDPACAAMGAMRSTAARAHAETLAHIRKPIGKIDTPLHTFFVQIAAARALRLIAAAQRAWFAEQRIAADVAHLPVISVAAPVQAGGRGGPLHYADIPAGALTQNHAHALYPYPNKLAAVVITGAELSEWLEGVARHFNAVPPGGRDVPLLREDAPAYNFDMFDGLDYTFDVSAPHRRLQALRHAGQTVAPADRFVVLTNAYRASGGGGLVPALPRDRHLKHGHGYNRSALVRHLSRGVAGAPEAGGWRVTAAVGSTAIFDTSPRAASYLHEIAAYRPETMGETPKGFLRLRLNF